MLAQGSQVEEEEKDFETAQKLQINLNSILNLFKDQKLAQKRAKITFKETLEKEILNLNNIHARNLGESEEKIRDLIRENERLQAKCFDFEQKLGSLRNHYDQLDSFRNSMISVLQSTAPSVLNHNQTLTHLSTSTATSRTHHQSLLDAAAKDQAFATHARSFIIEGRNLEEGSKQADLESALSDETAKPPATLPFGGPKNNSETVSSPTALQFTRNNSLNNRASFSNQVRPPTLLEAALNDSFFEKVKVEQEKAINQSTEDIPELVHDTTFEQSGLLTIELLEPPIMGIDTSIEHRQRTNTTSNIIKNTGLPAVTQPVDPATLYRQIRECVSPIVFEQFADCIAKFNNGMDTTATIKEIDALVPDERLKALMTRLILDASASSAA